jgi:hypothetical protein
VFGVDGCIGGLAIPDSSCVNGKLVAAVSGVTFQHGSTTFGLGAGIGTGAMLTLTHCVVTANQVTTTSQFGGVGIFKLGDSDADRQRGVRHYDLRRRRRGHLQYGSVRIR